MRAQDSARTIGKKTANSTVGKSTAAPQGRSTLRRLCAAAAAGALLLVSPAAAHAGCGGVVHARAAWHPEHRRAPLAIGDSVMLGAVPDLARAGFEVDARGCRQVGEAIHLLRRRIMAHSLPRVVVLAVGS